MTEDWADKKAFIIVGGASNNPSLEECFFKPIRIEIAQALRDAVAVERERCAKIAEEWDAEGFTALSTCMDIAAVIREEET